MLTLPAGKLLFRKRFRYADLSDVLPRKKWFYVKVKSKSGEGWAIFADRKNVYAAHFDDGFSAFFGHSALGRILVALNDAEVEVGLLGEKVATLFVSMHPETKVGAEVADVAAFVESRTLDAIDAAVGRVRFDMFTEEWEEGLVEVVSSEPGERVESAEAEVAEAVESKSVEPAGRQWVVSGEEFVYGLKGFTGVVRGREGSFEAEVYLKDGEIVGAVVRDEDIEIRGEAALFYLDRPLEVEVIECEPEVPAGAECGEDRRSVEALYLELDRSERGGGRWGGTT